MMAPWRLPTPKAQPQARTIPVALPRIETARLILRAPRIADWPMLEAVWTSSRAWLIGGPIGMADALADYRRTVQGWQLRGIGALAIEDKATGEVLGLTGRFLEFGDPEMTRELGWLLTPAARGRGIAREAAQGMRAAGLAELGFDELAAHALAGCCSQGGVAEWLGGLVNPDAVLDTDGDTAFAALGKSDGRPTKFRWFSDDENGEAA